MGNFLFLLYWQGVSGGPDIGPLRTLAAAYFEPGADIGHYYEPGAAAGLAHQPGATEGEYA